MTVPPAYVTAKEACYSLRVSRSTLRRYRRDGRLQWRWHVNGRWREYLRSDVERLQATAYRGDVPLPFDAY